VFSQYVPALGFIPWLSAIAGRMLLVLHPMLISIKEIYGNRLFAKF